MNELINLCVCVCVCRTHACMHGVCVCVHSKIKANLKYLL